MMIVPVKVTIGQAAGTERVIPVARVDEWMIQKGCVVVRFGTSQGVVQFPEGGDWAADTLNELYNCAALHTVPIDFVKGETVGAVLEPFESTAASDAD